jgi:ribosomal protein S18 acetylase RimI-like enzyme
MRLVPWQGDDLLRRIDDLIAVYGAAMGYPPDLLATRKGYIATHARRPGFRAVATLGDDGTLIGFGYGYTSVPGQWWHDQISVALRPPARRMWMSDCFEVVELHVHPAAQGHGIGQRQLCALLNGVPNWTVLLSTPEADEKQSRAWRLYRRFGFVDVLREFYFPGDERRFAILGRGLPLTAESQPTQAGTG